MQITDPIADLLTRIRNASTAKHPSVEIPASNMKKAICQILVDEGYIKGMQIKNDTVQGTIVVTLKYQANGESVIAGLRRVSHVVQLAAQRRRQIPSHVGLVRLREIALVPHRLARRPGLGLAGGPGGPGPGEGPGGCFARFAGWRGAGC